MPNIKSTKDGLIEKSTGRKIESPEVFMLNENFKKFPSWCCQKCGENIGYVGRFLLMGLLHKCQKSIFGTFAKNVSE